MSDLIDLTEPEPVPDGTGPQRSSVSQTKTFEECPRKWWWKYIRGLADPPGPDARRGTLVHTVMEHICLLPPAERTINAAARIAFEHWTGDDPPELRRLAWRNVLRALHLPQIVEAEVVDTEVELDVVLDGVPFKGFIDRVARGRGGLEIDDYKDGRHRDDASSKAEKKKQVILYAAAYPLAQQTLAAGGIERPVAASLIYTSAGVVDRHPVTDRAVESAVGWLKGQWDALRAARATGDFPVKPGGLCSWCPAVSMCPAGLDAVRARARRPGKSLGAHGVRALATTSAEVAARSLGVPVDVYLADDGGRPAF